MKVDGQAYRTIWFDEASENVAFIDQNKLPHTLHIDQMRSLEDAAEAILHMGVRGAPLIGATAAFGMYLALKADSSPAHEEQAAQTLLATRPTAVNLRWAIGRMRERLQQAASTERAAVALAEAKQIADDDAQTCEAIGDHGLTLLEKLWKEKEGKQDALRILTHCNAGWLATVDWGTALAPVYKAHRAGIPIQVWVDETRPRSQGAKLTAWELSSEGIAHKLIVDSASGHVMQSGLVDCCIVGSDRTTASGDVCNKIGTYPTALAARDNDIPFYVALPTSTIDWEIHDGLREIPIEERDANEVCEVTGITSSGTIETVCVPPVGTPAANYAFDVTPRHLVSALITERGVFAASPEELGKLKKEMG
jgi:methylthioribose-1-phosphate isomerase